MFPAAESRIDIYSSQDSIKTYWTACGSVVSDGAEDFVDVCFPIRQANSFTGSAYQNSQVHYCYNTISNGTEGSMDVFSRQTIS